MSAVQSVDQQEPSLSRVENAIPDVRKQMALLGYREKAYRALEAHGLMERDTQGRIICDVNRFKQKIEFDQLRYRLGPLYTRKEFGQSRMIDTFYWAFKDAEVYSKEDYARLQSGETVEAKPLFYIPKDKDEALSVEDIKKKDFYMGLWEVGDFRVLPMQYPTVDGNMESGLSTYEAITSCLLYHPNYGNAQRTEQGRLYANFNKEYVDKIYRGDTYRRPISGSFFESWGYYGAPDRHPVSSETGLKMNQTLIDKPVKFFLDRCPDMVERGLIDPFRDFRIEYTDSEFGSNLRHPTNRGLVTIGYSPETRRRYTIGSEYEGKRGYSVYPLSERYAAILKQTGNGEYMLEKVFELKSDQMSEEERDRVRFSRSTINKADITFFDPENVDGLSAEDGALVTNFKEFLAFSKRTSQEAGFPLINLSVKEKSLATALYLHYGENEQMWNFIRKYKLDGLRTMMAVEQAQVNADVIWELGEKMDATKLFSDVSDIVAAVTRYEDSIRTTLDLEEQHTADGVAKTIMSYTSKLLLAARPVLHEDPAVKGVIDITDIGNSIRLFKKRVSDIYAKQFGMPINDGLYERILLVYQQKGATDANLQAVALDALQQTWLVEAQEEERATVERVLTATDTFYSHNTELFEKANETTGDTEKQLETQ